MRWALLGLCLLLAAFGLLYRGGVAFMSSFTDATASASPRVDGPGAVAATTGQVAAPDRARPADQGSASGASRPGPAPAPVPAMPSNPEDASPIATEQRVFQSRRALETMDAREFLRHAPSSR